jgi:hypothetical protein
LEYSSWPLLTEILAQSFPGVKTSRDDAVVSIDRQALEERFERYFDCEISDEQMASFAPVLMEQSTQFNARKVRAYLQSRGKSCGRIVQYAYRPLDHRWVFWTWEGKLLDRPRPEYMDEVFPGNFFIEARQRQPKATFDRGYVVRVLADNFANGLSNFFPLFLRTKATSAVVKETPQMDLDMGGGGAEDADPVPNLTPFARDYLAELGAQPEDLFFHIVAILHSPAYRTENAGALRQDWPRVPLPKGADTLSAGAALGRQVAALLDPETEVPGVTDKKIRPELHELAALTISKDAKSKTPDLALTARWGYAGQGGVVMPGPGDVRSGTRGEGFVDVHLNATTRWKDVPVAVWNYTLGGYQVLKKWLSYREAVLLGRPLTADEALDFTKHVRRIAALLALHPALDSHYRASATPAVSEPFSPRAGTRKR